MVRLGVRLNLLNIPFTLVLIFLAFSILRSTWALSLRPGSNITPSYLVVLILNLISVPPIRILLLSVNLISEFFLALMNNTASIFLISKLTAFLAPHSITISLTFYRVFIISPTFLAPMMKPRSSTKDRLVTSGAFSSTSSNTPLM